MLDRLRELLQGVVKNLLLVSGWLLWSYLVWQNRVSPESYITLVSLAAGIALGVRVSGNGGPPKPPTP